MDKFANFIVTRKKLILILFIVATLCCALLTTAVNTNYDLTSYLPQNTQSTTAYNILNDEFLGNMPNTNVMVRDVSLPRALETSFAGTQQGVEGLNQLSGALSELSANYSAFHSGLWSYTEGVKAISANYGSFQSAP